MEPEEKESLVLSYLTHSFLGVLMAVVAFIIFTETRKPKVVEYENTFVMPEVNVLTSEEVETERYILVNNDLQQNGPVEVTEISLPNSSLTHSPTRITPKEPEDEIVEVTVIKGAGATLTHSTERKTVAEYNASFEDTSSDPNAKKTAKTLSGVVYSKDRTNNIITISRQNNAGFGMLKLKSDTKIMINGKAMSFSDIKVGDKITSEGMGYSDSNSLEAVVVIVTGSVINF